MRATWLPANIIWTPLTALYVKPRKAVTCGHARPIVNVRLVEPGVQAQPLGGCPAMLTFSEALTRLNS
jgi:hypothetical protein